MGMRYREMLRAQHELCWHQNADLDQVAEFHVTQLQGNGDLHDDAWTDINRVYRRASQF